MKSEVNVRISGNRRTLSELQIPPICNDEVTPSGLPPWPAHRSCVTVTLRHGLSERPRSTGARRPGKNTLLASVVTMDPGRRIQELTAYVPTGHGAISSLS